MLFVSNAWACFWNDPASGCENAWQTYLIYLVLDILFNIGVYMLVRDGSALLTFVSLKLMSPMTALLSLVPWPVIGASHITWAECASLLVVLLGAIVFRYGNLHKQRI